MWDSLPLAPERASATAGEVDQIYLFLIGVAVFFCALIFALILLFMVRYRRRKGHQARPVKSSLLLELTWTAIPLAIVTFVYIWGSRIYFEGSRPPDDAEQIYVVGKQWMWKVQHPTGPSEINELHVPRGQAVKLTMTSEDVIHSFYIPAFRVKMDVLPGRYTTLWFTPTKTGTYHLFCAEYCGTKHSDMIGKVVVMEPKAYQAWLAGTTADEGGTETGAQVFSRLGCESCHKPGPMSRAPDLSGAWGTKVKLSGGGETLFDETYVRESVIDPNKKIRDGFEPIMPTYQGRVTEEEVIKIITYIKSLEGKKR